MLNFEEFQEYAKNHVKQHMSDEYENATVSINTVEKNNGLVLHALVVKAEDSMIAPSIYLEGFFKQYEEGMGILEVMENLGQTCEMHQTAPDYSKDIAAQFKDFNGIKDKIVMSVVNVAKNQEMLAHIPHTMKEDLALIYKVCLGNDADGMATITIRDEHMSLWEVDTATLHELALENSNRILPATTRGMNEIMMEMLGRDMPPEVAEAIMADMPAENQMYVISNSANINGAAALFYSNALEQLSEKIGSDLYILPSSVHEAIAVSTEMGSPEMLANMVCEVNETQVSQEEQLSDHVYHYDAKSKEITLADTTVEELGVTSPKANQDMGGVRKGNARS